MKAIGIIPARWASSRFPGKPLADLCGKTVIARVWENAIKAKNISKVMIATDDQRILGECDRIGAEAILTDSDLKSGTDRICQAYKKIGEDYDLIVNIQGDEPFLSAESIDLLIENADRNDADVTTLSYSIKSLEELLSPDCVKIAMNANGKALYFSRSPIPYLRGIKIDNWLKEKKFYKHIGVYCYKNYALEKFVSLAPSQLEITESLEQLRLLEQGYSYFCSEIDEELISIDTPQDLEKAERRLILGNNKSSR